MSSSVDNYSSSGTENDDPYDLTYNDEAQELLNDAIASNNRNRKLNQRLRSASSASKKAGSKRKSTLLSEESSLVSSNDSKRNADEAKVTPKASTTNKRPGRKPLEKSAETPLDPKQKRKEQNRAAQRAFRERKERHVQELQERIRQLEEANAAHSDLIKENNLLKEQVKKLQEENYALKGTQFTFQYPLHDDMILGNGGSGSTDKSHYSLSSNSSIKSSSSSSEHNSPQSNPQDGGFNVTPQSDQSIEGLFAPPQNTDFLTQSLPVNDVKAPVYNFTDYRVPPSSADSLLLHNDTLPPLFGADVDLFGLSAPAPLNDTLETMEPPSCKTQVLETLRQVKGQSVRASDLQQRVQTYCPDFSLDQLCDDLKKKARCTQEVLTDKEVDCIINYIEQKKH